MSALAAAMLREAAAIVEGDRAETHGKAEQSFELIAHLWAAYLSHGSLTIGPADVAWMMVLLKVARARCGTPTRDHAVDAAGYAALAGALSA